MTYVLVIWTIVGMHGGGSYYNATDVRYDWRPIGEFKNATACLHAAKVLRKTNTEFICIPTDTK